MIEHERRKKNCFFVNTVIYCILDDVKWEGGNEVAFEFERKITSGFDNDNNNNNSYRSE